MGEKKKPEKKPKAKPPVKVKPLINEQETKFLFHEWLNDWGTRHK